VTSTFRAAVINRGSQCGAALIIRNEAPTWPQRRAKTQTQFVPGSAGTGEHSPLLTDNIEGVAIKLPWQFRLRVKDEDMFDSRAEG
jgi:hypothetical protein